MIFDPAFFASDTSDSQNMRKSKLFQKRRTESDYLRICGSGRRSEKLNAELIKLAVTACLWLFMAKTIYSVKKFERHCFSVKSVFNY